MSLYSKNRIRRVARTVNVEVARVEAVLSHIEAIGVEYLAARSTLRQTRATRQEADGRRRVAAQAAKLRDLLELNPAAADELEAATGTRDFRVFESVLKTAVALSADDEVLAALRKRNAEGEVVLGCILINR